MRGTGMTYGAMPALRDVRYLPSVCGCRLIGQSRYEYLDSHMYHQVCIPSYGGIPRITNALVPRSACWHRLCTDKLWLNYVVYWHRLVFCYAMSGTEIGHGSGTEIAYSSLVRTETAYGSARSVLRYGSFSTEIVHGSADPVLRSRMLGSFGTEIAYASGGTAYFLWDSLPPYGILLRTCYAMSTTDIAYVATSLRACYANWTDQYADPVANALTATGIPLCACYAMPGTGLADAAMHLRTCYAMSGTDLAYAATAILSSFPPGGYKVTIDPT
eukprot:1884224-Rhodomonas_salina.1